MTNTDVNSHGMSTASTSSVSPTMTMSSSQEDRQTTASSDHEYCNVDSRAKEPPPPPPPTLPRRQPNLRPTCTSPATSLKRKVSSNHNHHHAPPPPPPPPPTLQHHSCYNSDRAWDQPPQRRPPPPPISSATISASCSGCRCTCQCNRMNSHHMAANKVFLQENPPSNDVVLFYSRFCSGGLEWAKYLHKLFIELSKRKGKLNVKHLPIEDLAPCDIPPPMEAEIYGSRLQIVLLSPNFLEFLSKNHNFILGRLIHPDRVLAIMLGVKDNHIQKDHRESLLSFSHWIHLEAKDHDLEFVQTVLYFCTQILNRTSEGNSRSMRIRNNSCNSNNIGPRASSTPSNNNNHCNKNRDVFHIHPKKVTENHSRLLIIFETPQSIASKINLRLERNHPDLDDVELLDWTFINAFNIQVTVPRHCFAITNLASIRIEIDGQDRGTRIVKLESPLSELDQILKSVLDPMDFMCQALGIADKETLDKVLTKTFLEKIPKDGFAGLRLVKENVQNPVFNRDQSQFPTLLHFAAFHGLKNLSTMLLECPGARIAIDIKNDSDLTPPELAQLNSHDDPAKKLLEFQQKSRSEQSGHFYDYIGQPKTISGVETSEYQVPPPPRPIDPKMLNRCLDVIESNNNKENEDGLKMDRYLDLSGSETSSPKPNHKISQRMVNKSQQTPERNPVSQYQQIRSPPRPVLSLHDKFGTMKANNARSQQDNKSVDDVFLPSNQRNSSSEKPMQKDPFGTLRANKAVNRKSNQREEVAISGCNSFEEELAITNELLTMLEDFKNKSYSVKEMEIRFESWRRKAMIVDTKEKPKEKDLSDVKEKLKKYASANTTLLRLFRFSSSHLKSNVKQSEETKSTQKSTKNSGTDTEDKRNKPSKETKVDLNSPNFEKTHGLTPPLDNETIIERELCIINENEMSVVALPPTPEKTPTMGISSQILPLARLSSSSGSLPSPNALSEPNLDVNKNQLGSSPAKGKLQKLGKNLAEPIKHYFQDAQIVAANDDDDEPTVLNTPKSVSLEMAESHHLTSSKAKCSTLQSTNACNIQKSISRNLFKSHSMEDGFQEYENLPPVTITDM